MAPLYDYKGFDSQGKSKKGLVESETAKAARLKLKKQGFMVTEIHQRAGGKPGANKNSSFSGKASPKDVSLMTRQLASLIKANVPLVEALNALVDQSDKDNLKVVISKIRDDVNEGSGLAKAMAAHPKIFDTIYINMVEAGETSGTLGLVMLRLADLKEAQMRLRSKVQSGMMYPVLMMVMALLLLVGIFAFVIPQLVKIFDSMRREIPPITRLMIFVSDIVSTYWLLFFAGALLGGWMFRRWTQSKKGRERWDAMKLSMPLFGDLFRMIAVTRFAGTMSTLLSSGVPILTSMNIARNLVANVHIARAIENARENITEGQSIAEPLKKSEEFPPMVIHMIAIGEKTGELPQMLRNVADTYEEQVNTRIEGLTSLLEPLMIIGMGLVVGFIVVAVFIPLLDIQNIQ